MENIKIVNGFRNLKVMLTLIVQTKVSILACCLCMGFSSCKESGNEKSKKQDFSLVNYAGRWGGKLEISRMGKPWQTLNMRLTITPMADGNIDWQIEYGEKDKRPYLLRKGDKGSSHWIMDERNGILLDCFLNGASLFSLFEVQGSLLTCNYEFSDKYIDFTIRAGTTKEFTRSGDIINEKDTIPPTHSYLLPMYQSARLSRI